MTATRPAVPRIPVIRALFIALLLAAVVTEVAVVVQLQGTAESLQWNSDAASPKLIAESISDDGRASDAVVLGEMPYFSTLGLFLATAELPGRDVIWLWAPYVLSLIGAALLVTATWRLSGPRAAVVMGCLAVVVSQDVFLTQVAPAFRSTTWFSVALLYWWMVSAHLRTSERALAPHRVGCVLVGIACGVNLASDPLLLVVGVLPFGVAAWFGVTPSFAVHRRRSRISAALVVGATLLTAAATTAIWNAAGYWSSRDYRGDSYVGIASPSEIIDHARQLWTNLLGLAGLAHGGAGPDSRWGYVPLGFVLGGLVLAATTGVRTLRERDSHPAARAAAAFWLSCAALLISAYLFSGIPDPTVQGTTNVRYLVPLLWAVVALVVMRMTRRPATERLVAVGCCVMLAVLAPPLVRGDTASTRNSGPLASQTPALVSWLQAHGVTRGVGDYWTAAPLSVRGALTVRAIERCGAGICPRVLNGRGSWYDPVDRGSTFAVFPVADPAMEATVDAAARTGITVRARRRFGALTAVVFDGDIMRAVEPWPSPREGHGTATRAAGLGPVSLAVNPPHVQRTATGPREPAASEGATDRSPDR